MIHDPNLKIIDVLETMAMSRNDVSCALKYSWLRHAYRNGVIEPALLDEMLVLIRYEGEKTYVTEKEKQV